MGITRRSFLSAVSAGGLLVAFPVIAKRAAIDNPHGFSVENAEKFRQNLLKNSVTLIIILPEKTSKIDQQGQKGWLGWKAKGKDSNQYGNCMKITESQEYYLGFADESIRQDSVTEMSKDLHSSMIYDVSGHPELSNITVPSWQKISSYITEQLNTG